MFGINPPFDEKITLENYCLASKYACIKGCENKPLDRIMKIMIKSKAGFDEN